MLTAARCLFNDSWCNNRSLPFEQMLLDFIYQWPLNLWRCMDLNPGSNYWSTVEDPSSSTLAFNYYKANLNLYLKSIMLINQKYTTKRVKSLRYDAHPTRCSRGLDHRSATVTAWYFLRETFVRSIFTSRRWHTPIWSREKIRMARVTKKSGPPVVWERRWVGDATRKLRRLQRLLILTYS